MTCPVYCCMPDHSHLMWMGLFPSSDQLTAMKYFRKQTNGVLRQAGSELQRQAYDNVVPDDQRRAESFEDICEYNARNPERSQLVGVDQFREYAFTGSLVPGAPELTIRDADFWPAFWRAYAHAVQNGLVKGLFRR